MRAVRVVCTCALLFAIGYALAVRAQERLILAAPVFTDAGAAEFRVASLYLNLQTSELRVTLAEVVPGTPTFKPNGRTLPCFYSDATADGLLAQLNKANFSGVSLERRLTQQCQADGKLGPGIISGTPR
jgi:hypothetical protein